MFSKIFGILVSSVVDSDSFPMTKLFKIDFVLLNSSLFATIVLVSDITLAIELVWCIADVFESVTVSCAFIVGIDHLMNFVLSGELVKVSVIFPCVGTISFPLIIDIGVPFILAIFFSEDIV